MMMKKHEDEEEIKSLWEEGRGNPIMRQHEI